MADHRSDDRTGCEVALEHRPSALVDELPSIDLVGFAVQVGDGDRRAGQAFVGLLFMVGSFRKVVQSARCRGALDRRGRRAACTPRNRTWPYGCIGASAPLRAAGPAPALRSRPGSGTGTRPPSGSPAGPARHRQPPPACARSGARLHRLVDGLGRIRRSAPRPRHQPKSHQLI